MLTHELNNYTMQEAMNFYTTLKRAFTVCHSPAIINSQTDMSDHKGGLVPIGVAYNKTQPYVETDYTFPDYAECMWAIP